MCNSECNSECNNEHNSEHDSECSRVVNDEIRPVAMKWSMVDVVQTGCNVPRQQKSWMCAKPQMMMYELG